MKKLAVFLVLAAAVFTISCKKLPEFTSSNGSSGGGTTPTVATPKVSTWEAYDITANHAVLNGVISNYDGNYTYETGFYCGTTENLDIFIAADDAGHGTFVAKFDGLTANTTYYYIAYAIISGASQDNAGYGEIMSFTTSGDGSVEVITMEATDVTSTTAVLNGKITNYNSSLSYICYMMRGTSPGSFDLTYGPAYPDNNGSWSISVTGLVPNTTYYIKAQATYDGASNYYNGEVLSFTTLAGDN